jgi:hypothetical protein
MFILQEQLRNGAEVHFVSDDEEKEREAAAEDSR